MITNFKTPKAMRIEFTNEEAIVENIVGISMDDTWVTYVYIDDDEDTYCRSIKASEVKEVLLLEPGTKKESKEADDIDMIVKEMDRMYNEMFGDLM